MCLCSMCKQARVYLGGLLVSNTAHTHMHIPTSPYNTQAHTHRHTHTHRTWAVAARYRATCTATVCCLCSPALSVLPTPRWTRLAMGVGASARTALEYLPGLRCCPGSKTPRVHAHNEWGMRTLCTTAHDLLPCAPGPPLPAACAPLV